MDNSPFYNLQPQLHSGDLQTFRHQKSFRHLDDLALDVSAPRRFGTKRVNSPGRFGTKTFRYQCVSAPDGWMDWWVDGRTDGLAVELPIKFKFFTVYYGSKSLYVWGQKNEPFAHNSPCIRAVVKASFSHLFFFLSGRDGLLIAPGSCILAQVDYWYKDDHRFVSVSKFYCRFY